MRSNDDEAYFIVLPFETGGPVSNSVTNNRGAPSSYVKLGMCRGSPHPSTRKKKLSEHLVGTIPRQIRYFLGQTDFVPNNHNNHGVK